MTRTSLPRYDADDPSCTGWRRAVSRSVPRDPRTTNLRRGRDSPRRRSCPLDTVRIRAAPVGLHTPLRTSPATRTRSTRVAPQSGCSSIRSRGPPRDLPLRCDSGLDSCLGTRLAERRGAIAQSVRFASRRRTFPSNVARDRRRGEATRASANPGFEPLEEPRRLRRHRDTTRARPRRSARLAVVVVRSPLAA